MQLTRTPPDAPPSTETRSVVVETRTGAVMTVPPRYLMIRRSQSESRCVVENHILKDTDGHTETTVPQWYMMIATQTQTQTRINYWKERD